MKKIILIATSILLAIVAIASISYVKTNEFQYFDLQEQKKAKEGKLFWEWPSQYGPLAIHYIEKGKGSDHLILLHGYRSHVFTWRHFIEPLAQAGYHVWVIDLIGYGLSDKPSEVPYDYQFFVDQVESFMRAKGIKSYHLIGNSMGGGLALSLALSQPTQVKSLTLISALGYPLRLPFYFTISKKISYLWKSILGPSLIRDRLKQIVFDKDAITDEQVEAYILPYRFPGGLEASVTTLENFDNVLLAAMREKYRSLIIPVLIIWGEKDTLIPLSHFEKFQKDFPRSDKCLIPNCGHIPQEEKPDEVLAAILPFLKKTSP